MPEKAENIQEEIKVAGVEEAESFEAADLLKLEAVYEVPIDISVVLGSTSMTISELLRVQKGKVIELNRKVGEAVDIYVNGRLVARGEVVIVEENIGITLTEIIKLEK